MLHIHLSQIIVMLMISYGYRKNSLQRIIEEEKSKKQQRQLKNLFDSQPDGVVILSQAEPVLKPPVKEAPAAEVPVREPGNEEDPSDFTIEEENS